MKRSLNFEFLSMLILIVSVLATAIVVAGQVYDRKVQALSATAGSGTWENDVSYSALALKCIWVERGLIAINTVTVSRVTSGGAYTQSVGSVVTASGSGSTSSLTASYLKPGDSLVFASTVATGATAIIEYEVQQH
jgi:hypothetical protein